jgi:zinc transporter ZupT
MRMSTEHNDGGHVHIHPSLLGVGEINSATIVPFILTLVMSIHSFIAGMALGIQVRFC